MQAQMSRNASTSVEKCKHKCVYMYIRWNVEHLKINADIYVCLRRYKCKINAVRNAVHARMLPYGVYGEGLQRAFGFSQSNIYQSATMDKSTLNGI
jgi:hypothetical protein